MEQDNKEVMVSIQCLTYNHASFIRKCLEGIVMQKTNFMFEAIVHDDASTDGTTEIIREFAKNYPEIIKPIYEEENQYSKGIPGRITSLVNEKSRGKYIAICEGDDFWTNPSKLQMQFDILERNANVSLVHTSFQTIDSKGDPILRPKYERYIKRSKSGNILPMLFYSNYIISASIMFRKGILQSELYKQCKSRYDYTLFFSAAFMGECAYIPLKCCSYRRTEGSSITTRTDAVEKGLYVTFIYFVQKFLEGENVIRCSLWTTYKIYVSILSNLFFNKDYPMLRNLIKHKYLSVLAIPVAFAISGLRKIKKKTYGSTIDK